MPPEGRPRLRDPRGELAVGAGDGLPEVKARKICAPAFAACTGDSTKDAGELVQWMPPRSECFGRRFELEPEFVLCLAQSAADGRAVGLT